MRKSDVTYKYGVNYSFSGSIDRLEDWLEMACNGKYAYEFKDIKETDAGFNKLEVLFRFELDEDRIRFRKLITSGQAPW